MNVYNQSVSPNYIYEPSLSLWNTGTVNTHGNLDAFGNIISISSVASGVCTCSNTYDLAPGMIFIFYTGAFADVRALITSVTTNTSFTLYSPDNSFASDGACTGYQYVTQVKTNDQSINNYWTRFYDSTAPTVMRQFFDSTYVATRPGSFHSWKIVSNETSASLNHGVGTKFGRGMQNYGAIDWHFHNTPITVGCWVKADAVGIVSVGLKDTVSGTNSLSRTNLTTNWEWMEHTIGPMSTFPTGVTTARYSYFLSINQTAHVVYMSNPYMTYGDHIGPQVGFPNGGSTERDVVGSNGAFQINNWWGATFSSGTYTPNMMLNTNGALPITTSAVYITGNIKDSGSASTDCSIQVGTNVTSVPGCYCDIQGTPNSTVRSFSGWAALDVLTGNLPITIVASGTSTMTVNLAYSAVRYQI